MCRKKVLGKIENKEKSFFLTHFEEKVSLSRLSTTHPRNAFEARTPVPFASIACAQRELTNLRSRLAVDLNR